MKPGRGAVVYGLFASALGGLAGCDSSAYVPPPPPGLRPSTTQTTVSTPVAAQEIALILPGETNPEVEAWDAVARKEAGEQRVGYRLLRPEPTDPPSKQAELVKQAARSASALMVVTNRSPETTAALAAASAENKPILLLGRPLPDSPEAAKVKATLVAYEPMTVSAKKLVAGAADDAKRAAGAAAKGPIECVVIASKVKDESSDERVKALLDEAKAAGLNVVATVEFDGTAPGLTKALEGPTKAHPKLGVLLTDDEVALSGLTNTRQLEIDPSARPGYEAKGEPIPVPAKTEPPPATALYKIAGYFTTRTNANLAKFGQVSAVADRNVSGLVRRAMRAARDLLDGKTVPPKVEVELPVIRSQLSADRLGRF